MQTTSAWLLKTAEAISADAQATMRRQRPIIIAVHTVTTTTAIIILNGSSSSSSPNPSSLIRWLRPPLATAVDDPSGGREVRCNIRSRCKKQMCVCALQQLVCTSSIASSLLELTEHWLVSVISSHRSRSRS